MGLLQEAITGIHHRRAVARERLLKNIEEIAECCDKAIENGAVFTRDQGNALKKIKNALSNLREGVDGARKDLAVIKSHVNKLPKSKTEKMPDIFKETKFEEIWKTSIEKRNESRDDTALLKITLERYRKEHFENATPAEKEIYETACRIHNQNFHIAKLSHLTKTVSEVIQGELSNKNASIPTADELNNKHISTLFYPTTSFVSRVSRNPQLDVPKKIMTLLDEKIPETILNFNKLEETGILEEARNITLTKPSYYHYILAPIAPNTPPQPNTLYYKCTDDGLKYQVVKPNGEAVTAIIPWSELKVTGIMTDEDIQKDTGKWSAAIQEITLKNGHTEKKPEPSGKISILDTKQRNLVARREDFINLLSDKLSTEYAKLPENPSEKDIENLKTEINNFYTEQEMNIAEDIKSTNTEIKGFKKDLKKFSAATSAAESKTVIDQSGLTDRLSFSKSKTEEKSFAPNVPSANIQSWGNIAAAFESVTDSPNRSDIDNFTNKEIKAKIKEENPSPPPNVHAKSSQNSNTTASVIRGLGITSFLSRARKSSTEGVSSAAEAKASEVVLGRVRSGNVQVETQQPPENSSKTITPLAIEIEEPAQKRPSF